MVHNRVSRTRCTDLPQLHDDAGDCQCNNRGKREKEQFRGTIEYLCSPKAWTGEQKDQEHHPITWADQCGP